jgi:hypothetical protein
MQNPTKIVEKTTKEPTKEKDTSEFDAIKWLTAC